MLNATTQIKRTIVLAGTLAAVAAPSASARIADAPVPSPSAASRSAEPAVPASSMAHMAAHRAAIATKRWQAANPSTIIEVSSSPDGDGGLDLPSAGIGAAVPLTLVLIAVISKWVLRRRRENQLA